eukprot:CAMPEP_0168342112 /NCGR_PEP_ID=MMETSP0213-20121227/15155_1 /TAXON_ID=151035 /ORGANISM="Euplotes harpa, Strain FSP1.4" /LENGTH=115 /DNA_ID=CAMNT_0008348857 /DNA_START=1 /DNA_END=348 /DNA_ORIENTATION=-
MDDKPLSDSLHEVLVVGHAKAMDTLFSIEVLKRNKIPYTLYDLTTEPNAEEYLKSLQEKFNMKLSEFVVLSRKFITNCSVLEHKEENKTLIKYLTSTDPQDSEDEDLYGPTSQCA